MQAFGRKSLGAWSSKFSLARVLFPRGLSEPGVLSSARRYVTLEPFLFP